MKILHTSDWHIGRVLYGRKRYKEFDAFLNWLADLIEQENIETDSNPAACRLIRH
jgi:exonuclease SbcD